MPQDPHRFVLTPPRLTRMLGAILLILVSLHAAALFVSHGLGYPVALGFVPLLHLDFERNLPTFVSFLLLMACALVSAWTSDLERARPRHQRAWAFVALLFLLVAADELFSFHELFGEGLYAQFAHLGVPMFAWVLPYGAAVGVLGLIMLRWFLDLDRSFQLRLMAAAALFLGGAIGLELLASSHYQALPEDREVYRTLTGDLLATAEEICELIGAAFFLHTMVGRLGGISFRALDPRLESQTAR